MSMADLMLHITGEREIDKEELCAEILDDGVPTVLGGELAIILLECMFRAAGFEVQSEVRHDPRKEKMTVDMYVSKPVALEHINVTIRVGG